METSTFLQRLWERPHQHYSRPSDPISPTSSFSAWGRKKILRPVDILNNSLPNPRTSLECWRVVESHQAHETHHVRQMCSDTCSEARSAFGPLRTWYTRMGRADSIKLTLTLGSSLQVRQAICYNIMKPFTEGHIMNYDHQSHLLFPHKIPLD